MNIKLFVHVHDVVFALFFAVSFPQAYGNEAGREESFIILQNNT